VRGSIAPPSLSTLTAVTLAAFAAAATARAAGVDPPAPLCSGTYADDFSALSSQAREFDRQPQSAFSYCVRNTAVYECLSYGADGAVRHDRRTAVLHGTAFAYRRQAAETLLLTNDHVAAWPTVTDAQHTVDGVPAGCKKVTETLALVDDEHDSYGRDDIPVTRVVTDAQLDVAVLKTSAALTVMPWKVGHDARLRERNVVEVRGFPLGAFRATNAGTVISAHDHDDFCDWDHDDFVIDALLSHGNSGSPVLAVSCATGEYELVGIYHAGYSEGSALNVVVGIDQVRDLMTTLKRAPHGHQGDPVALDASARRLIRGALDADGELFFPFGAQMALARPGADDSLVFALFGKEFPQSSEPSLVIEDLSPGADPEFGRLGRIWFGAPQGLQAHDRTALDAEAQAQAARVLDGLRADAAASAAYQQARRADMGSRQAADTLRRMKRTLTRTAASRGDLLQAATDLADRFAPQPGEHGLTLADLAPLRPTVEPAAPPPAKPAPLASTIK
jgi:S1-C subfamily serine protease